MAEPLRAVQIVSRPDVNGSASQASNVGREAEGSATEVTNAGPEMRSVKTMHSRVELFQAEIVAVRYVLVSVFRQLKMFLARAPTRAAP